MTCPHGRITPDLCPHCMGLNELPPSDTEWEFIPAKKEHIVSCDNCGTDVFMGDATDDTGIVLCDQREFYAEQAKRKR